MTKDDSDDLASLEAKAKVRKLVERFSAQESSFAADAYNETQVRREFIDPFFEAFGWDVENRGDAPQAYKDVVHEDALKIGSSSRAPDYSFRIGGQRRFFVEAKKPSVNVHQNIAAAFQVRRYAWSAKLPISIVTDFQEFAVYDCRLQPKAGDRASVGRTLYLKYDEYLGHWDQLWALFSRGAVSTGSIEGYVKDVRATRSKKPVDAAFLTDIKSWRAELASDVAKRNASVSVAELNAVVQSTIDRIVFLRICEDRGIEPAGQLEELVGKPDVYKELQVLYRLADRRYNSGLFHFEGEPGRSEDVDLLSMAVEIGNAPLEAIIRRLYYPESPYEFAFLPADILGQVYEQFLGHVIALDENHEATVEVKPAVKKAKGVFYTPTHIVDHIVEDTLGPLVRESTPSKVERLRIVDPSCGSGSFLLGAFEFLLRWHRDWYVSHPKRYSSRIFQTASGEWVCTSAEKRRILLSNIFGVDLDDQAVEVTKLSLLLKVLENESKDSLERQLSLLHDRALPDLAGNIRAGNSLIGADAYAQLGLDGDDEVAAGLRPFEWRDEFPQVFAEGGFDAVIGNPPWLMAGYHEKQAREYLTQKYASAVGKFDVYYTFLERSLAIVREGGRVGMIVPNKFFHTRSATSLRELLATGRWVRRVVDFRASKVFERATNYSCILTLQKGATEPPTYVRSDAKLEFGREIEVPWTGLDRGTWVFLDRPTKALFDRIDDLGQALGDLTDRFGSGVQTGADPVLSLEPSEAAALHLEPEMLRPMLRGRDIRRFRSAVGPKRAIFPYTEDGEAFNLMTPEAVAAYPNTWRWLCEHKDRLAKRVWFDKSAAELSGDWYGLMYIDPLPAFKRPHLLSPCLSPVANFTLGDGTLFATGTAGVVSVVPKMSVDEDLLYLMGILNSELISSYSVAKSPIFDGGFFKFSADYIRGLPIKRIDFGSTRERSAHDEIVKLVQRRLKAETAAGPQRVPLSRALEGEIDRIVEDLYGITDEERDILATLQAEF